MANQEKGNPWTDEETDITIHLIHNITKLRHICSADFTRYFLLLHFFNKNKYINHNKINGSAIL